MRGIWPRSCRTLSATPSRRYSTPFRESRTPRLRLLRPPRLRWQIPRHPYSRHLTDTGSGSPELDALLASFGEQDAPAGVAPVEGGVGFDPFTGAVDDVGGFLRFLSEDQGGRRQLFNESVYGNPGFDSASNSVQSFIRSRFDPLEAQYLAQGIADPSGGSDFRSYLSENPTAMSGDQWGPLFQAISDLAGSVQSQDDLDMLGMTPSASRERLTRRAVRARRHTSCCEIGAPIFSARLSGPTYTPRWPGLPSRTSHAAKRSTARQRPEPRRIRPSSCVSRFRAGKLSWGNRMFNSGLFSSQTCDWATPKALLEDLSEEFGPFDLDPCPYQYEGVWSGLALEWKGRVYVNPPYGRVIGEWVKKAYDSAQQGALVVCLLPSRTDIAWWHDYVMKADEIRFIRGRLRFNEAGPAPFPSCVAIFKPQTTRQ